MNRGDTPTITYKGIPCEPEDIAEAKIYLYGSRKMVFDKDRISMSSGTMAVTLTQQETLGMSDREKLRMQIRLRTTGGKAYTSNVMETTLGEILEAGVI